MLLLAFDQEGFLYFLHLRGFLGEEFFRFVKVVRKFVQSPFVVIKPPGGAARRDPRKPAVTSRGNPTIFVDRAVTEHLEVLDVARACGFWIIETVHHADALDRLLLHAIYLCRLKKLCCFKNGGRDV